ncbi:MAG: Apolipoprotein N-acyltransferase [Smithella sp. PtaU1.Bin162]|nr:MAG: Apolipoprotein N-acyltransferase [Smithella sp. PtaU1.Bin162]
MEHNILLKYLSSTFRLLTSKAVFLAAISGALLFLSFPKYGSGMLAWIALIPLFWATMKETTSLRQGLLLGFITGLICNIGVIYWIAYVVVNYGYLPLYQGIIVMLLLACYLSLYTALFTAGLVVCCRRKISLCFAAPALWICLEYCKSYFLTGFPWENLGYSQYLNNYLIQFADVFGVFGISFLIVLANAALFEVVSKRSKKEFIFLAAVALIIISVLVYGVNRSKYVEEYLRKAKGIEVSLVQGNIDQSVKWNEKFQKETINIYEEITLSSLPIAGSLIVWPETALPFNYQDVNVYQKQVRGISLKAKSWFIFGSTSYENSKTNTDYYNSAYLLSPDGDIKGKYNKVHLVPYGEYVPLRNVFPFIKKLTAGMGDFTAGTGYNTLVMGDKKIGILICYEGILPFAARTYKKAGAELLVNITNDAWFGATSAPFQHFSMTIFRAVENRLYLVRAANTGISAIVDPNGKIAAETSIFEKTSLKGNIKYSTIKTIYAQYGDILVFACFSLIIICCFALFFKRRENKK